MSLLEDAEIIKITNSSRENVMPQVESSPLENNLKSKTLSSLPSSTVSKRYQSKFKKE